MNFLGEMTMIRKIMLGAILVASTSALYSIDASTQTEPQTKSFISMQRVEKAIDQSARFIRKHRNSKETRIGGHALKILGGLWLVARTGNFLRVTSVQSVKHRQQEDENAQPSLLQDIFSPQTSFKNKDVHLGDKSFRLARMPRPSYITALAISIYLIYDGCYGIYNELKPRKKKNDTATS